MLLNILCGVVIVFAIASLQKIGGALNTELTIHALDQVHCWDTYFRLRIGHYENFTPLNFQPLLFSKQ
jgi:hypothetical protein